MPSQINTTTNGQQDDDDYIIRSSKPVPEYPKIPVAQLLAESIEKLSPDLVAYIDNETGATITYGELHHRSLQFASGLLQSGITNHDFVTFLSENTLQHIIAMLGAIYLGVPLGITRPACGPFELTEQMANSSTTILCFGGDKLDRLQKALSNAKYSQIMSNLKLLVQLDGLDEDLKDLQQDFSRISGNSTRVKSFQEVLDSISDLITEIPHFRFENLESDPYFLSYTSGTTGPPKAAVQSNRSFTVSLVNFLAMKGPSQPGEHVIMWHPMGHISGAYFVHCAILEGSTVILFRDNQLGAILRAVQEYKVPSFTMAPGHATELVNNDFQNQFDLSSLKFIPHGGSKIAPNLLLKIREKYNVVTMDMYGSSEFLGGVGERDFEKLEEKFVPGNLGTVLPGVEMRIVDLVTGKNLPPHHPGEICFRGPSCFVGYLNNPSATDSTIINGWYHSGDVGYVDEAGDLYITDRIKEMIKFRYISVTPAEIEEFLHRHEAVEAVCVVGVPHKTDYYWARAYVQVAEGKVVEAEELIQLVHENMGLQNRLRAGVVFVPSMPRTVIAKVDRQHFKQLVKDELLTEIAP